MITYSEQRIYPNGKKWVEAEGMSTDSKPTETIANGSRFIEMDTGKIYMFDEAAGEWIEFGA